MSVEIISAQMTHAADIAHIIKVSFGEDADASTIAEVIKSGKHYPLIAILDDVVVGFIDGFLTKSSVGHIRAELDLLAVHPDCQGRGIGKKLINTFTKLQEVQSADYIRTLVRVDNTPMQYAISKCGYSSDKMVQALYILPKMPTKPASQSTHIVSVGTFTYRGIWLEGVINANALDALSLTQSNTDQITGAVVPIANMDTIAQLKKRNFEAVNDYHWWVYSLA